MFSDFFEINHFEQRRKEVMNISNDDFKIVESKIRKEYLQTLLQYSKIGKTVKEINELFDKYDSELKQLGGNAFEKRNESLLVDGTDTSGNTALMWASLRGHIEIVNYLLMEQNANVNHKNNDLQTALMYACSEGNLTTAKALICHGADINHQDKWGDFPLKEAAYENHVELVKLLLSEKHIDLTLKNVLKQDVVDVCRIYQNHDCLKIIEQCKLKKVGDLSN